MVRSKPGSVKLSRRQSTAHGKRNISFKKRISLIILYVVLSLFALVFLIPFFWMISTSLKPPTQIWVFPPQWIPRPVMWGNFLKAWTIMPFNLYTRNSVIVTLGTVLGQAFSATLAAYAFARLRARFRGILFIMVIGTMMIPYQVRMIPEFLIFNYLDWIDSFKPLILPFWLGGNAFFVFLLRQFFLTIPKQLDDAARIDGCSSFRIFWQIILPLAKPALATLFIFSFLWNWNDFIRPLIYLSTQEKYTLPIALQLFYSAQVDGAMEFMEYLMADSLIVLLPCLLIFVIAQKYIVRGIALTGIKT